MELDQISPPADQLAALSNDGSKVQKAPDGGAGFAGQKVRIGGSVKTGRVQGKGTFAFFEVNDGSCPANLQVMVDSSVSDLSKLVATGTCVTVDGFLKIPPEGARQKIELSAEKVTKVGTVDPATYPIPKTKLTLEDLEMEKKLEELEREDLDMKKKSLKKLMGFDVFRDRMTKKICDDDRPCPPLVRLYAKYGLHRYNMLQGTNLQLIRVKKYVKTTHSAASSYYITLAAMDPATTKLLTFLAQVAEESYGKLILSCSIARPLGANTDDDGASYVFLSTLFRVLPEFLPEDLFENRKRFYVVKESEIEHNDWIRLYLELAIVTTHRNYPEKLDLSSLKIDKVAIETTKEEEEDIEEEETLNNEGSLNAMVYIRYKDFCEARVGKDVDRIAIVRRTFNQSKRCFILTGRTQRFEFMPQKE